MNSQRRKILKQVQGLLVQVLDILNNVKDQEEEAYENLPMGFQTSERGERMGECVSNLESMIGNVEDIGNTLDEIING